MSDVPKKRILNHKAFQAESVKKQAHYATRAPPPTGPPPPGCGAMLGENGSASRENAGCHFLAPHFLGDEKQDSEAQRMKKQPANMRERAPRYARSTPANSSAPAEAVPVTLRLVTPGTR